MTTTSKRHRIETTTMLLGFNLRARREDAGMSQAQLGARVQCTRQQIDYIERGMRNPSAALLRRLRECFGGSTS